MEDSLSKIWRDIFCLNTPYPFNSFKGCLPQIFLSPFLNTLSHIINGNVLVSLWVFWIRFTPLLCAFVNFKHAMSTGYGIIHLVCTQNFPKNLSLLYSGWSPYLLCIRTESMIPMLFCCYQWTHFQDNHIKNTHGQIMIMVNMTTKQYDRITLPN